MNPVPAAPKLPEVDVELVLEGSYPYVTGGVSTWVHQLILGIPELKFGLIHIAARREDTRELKYAFPANVGYLQNIYLHDPVFVAPRPDSIDLDDSDYLPQLFQIHQEARTGSPEKFKDLFQKLLDPRYFPSFHRMFTDEKAFAFLVSRYHNLFREASFLDFFWTWRFMHFPLIQLFQSRRGPAGIVHAVSTGYAGAYGALRKIVDGTSLLLTEHGIYTRERNIEITQAEWIFSEAFPDHLVRGSQGSFKRMWMNFFNALGHWTYEMADHIITLFEGNRKVQLHLGAKAEKIEIIPNGISVGVFHDLRPYVPPDPEAPRIGFVGRIVPIKDVRTFLTAAQIVLLRCPEAQFYLIGPLDEDEPYAMEMQELANSLQIGKSVHFLGRQKVIEWYPRMDVCVLTSLSEGQPLSLLEAMAAGVPSVSTDVGGCRELLEGRTREDQNLGPCGILTNLRSPNQTAQAILDICGNKDRYLQMVRIGKIRVQTYYQESDLLKRYRRIYSSYLDSRRKAAEKREIT